MKTKSKIAEHTDKNKKKISRPEKVRGNPKVKEEEVCVAPDLVVEEQLCCCEDVCC